MNWLTPTLAIVAASIAVPSLLILYFLKLRRRDVEISTTLLWKKAIEDLQANAPFQKLRKNILLLLQLLILAAALIAVGQPMLKSQAATAARHVILIDRSASMSAGDGDLDGRLVPRLESAKAAAIRLIDSLREPSILDKSSGDQAMVIAFDTTAKALQTWTTDKSLLKAAVEAITPSDAPSSFDEAWRLVQAQAPPRRIVEETKDDGTVSKYERPPEPVGTIHLFTDGRLPDLAKAAPSTEEPVIYYAQGKPETANVGITSLRAGRAFEDPRKLSIFVGLQSTERIPRTVDVELQIDQTPVAIKSVPLSAATVNTAVAPTGSDAPAPGSPAPALTITVSPALGGTVFTLDRPEGGIVTIRVTPPETDYLRTDDLARLVVPPAKKLAVAVVTRGNLFIATALQSLPLAKLDTLSPEQYEQSRAAGKENYDVVVLDGYLPTVPAPAAGVVGGGGALPAGRFLIFNAIPHGLAELDKPGPGEFLEWSRDHPALRGLRLDPILIGKVRHVEVPKGAAATVLATSGVGPAMIELSTAEARALVVPFDVADSSWGFDVSFVVFMAQAVGFLGEARGGPEQSLQPGGVVADRLPPGARDVRVRLPDNTQADVGEPAPDGTIVYGPVERAGVYQLSWSGQPGPTDAVLSDRAIRPFAVNLLDTAESDIGAATRLDMASKQVASSQEDLKTTRPLWPWLLLAALAVCMLEWFVYNRKVHV
ncbi:MAG: BatA and WFA domain-containing protein [Phycisphaerales bacterium]